MSYLRGDTRIQVGAPAERQGAPRSEIVLQPGDVAHADLKSVFTGNFPASKCQPTHVRGLRVYPPNDFYAMYIPRAGTGCANSAVTQLTVKTTAPGPGR